MILASILDNWGWNIASFWFGVIVTAAGFLYWKYRESKKGK